MKTKHILRVLLLVAASAGLFCSCGAKGDKTISALEDLNELRIGVVSGTTHATYVKEDFPGAKTVTFENSTDIIFALKNKKVDAVAFDTYQWYEIENDNPELYSLAPHWHAEPFGVIFNKSNTELLDSFNAFLKDFRESGELQKLVERWETLGEEAEMADFSDVPHSGEPLKIGCTGTTPLYDFIRDGENCGLDIDLVRHFAASIGRPIEFNVMNFGGLVASTSAGIVDMATSSICITPERAEKVNFSDSYANGYSGLLVRRTSVPGEDGFMTLDDLADKSVGTLLGSTQDLWFKAQYPDAKYNVFNSKADVINALVNGQSDAIVMDEASAVKILQDNPHLAVLADDFCPVTFSVCFRKNSPLLNHYNVFQAEMKASGELDALFAKWKDTTRVAEHKPVEFEKFGGKPVRFGTTLLDVPYSYIIDGKPSGADVELVSLFAKKMKMDVEIVALDFSGLISGLATGYIDVAANSIMYTEERGEQIAFADPYQKIASYAIVQGKDLAPSHPNAKNFETPKKSVWKVISDSFYNNIIKERRWMLILEGLGYTVLISILSLLLGTLLSVGVCALRMSRNPWLSGFAKYYIIIVRGIPILVLLMILFYVVFAKLGVNAVTVAVFAFSINFSAFASEIFRSGLEGIDPGQRRAGIAMGFTGFQTFRYIILPQAIKQVLSVFKGEAGGLVKMTSVVGYIAVMDLTKASDIIRSRTFDAFFPLIIITVIYFALTWLLGKALDLLDTSSKK